MAEEITEHPQHRTIYCFAQYAVLAAEIQNQRSLLASPELWVSMDEFQMIAGKTSGTIFPLC